MKAKTFLFAAVLIGCAAASFYAGRKTAPPPPEQGRAHADASPAAPSGLVLSAGLQRKFGAAFARVEQRTLARAITATGSVQANASRLAAIRALARGRIEEVYVRPGDRVRRGQRLLTYDNIELGDAIGEYLAALAELEKAEAETVVSRQSLERARKLVALGAVAKAELQRREVEYHNVRAAVESRKAAAARIEEKLHRFGMTDAEIAKLDPDQGPGRHRESSHSTLTAPFSGVITQFQASPGETVATEDVLMTVADLSTVWVQADVYEKDIHAVREGQRAAIVTASYPGRVFTGTVSYVSDVLDPATRTAKVRVEVPNQENLLKLEMFATVSIPAPGRRAALAIPAAAVQTAGGRTVAFVRTGAERFEMRPLTLGERSGEWVEVLDGLKAGETVVTEGSFLLKSEAGKEALGEDEH